MEAAEAKVQLRKRTQDPITSIKIDISKPLCL